MQTCNTDKYWNYYYNIHRGKERRFERGNVIELLNEDDEVLENTSIFTSTSLINKDCISITDLLAGLYAKQRKGLSIAKNGDGNRDCDECAGVILNNLGLIHERRENNELAVSLYNNAIEFAEKALDFIGIEDFTRNLNRVRTREENSEQNILDHMFTRWFKLLVITKSVHYVMRLKDDGFRTYSIKE
ncbi:8041_t:CDS:2 [Funneliformis caledonium]|uniref:8041_t:CDS:1 n=1 Tax=Funneliformis caledonium TaxID=1117310 RepID=A0A9N9CRH6_9GLOM|nr:8041_t:CDS:2 [Funneliformis caledonium]